jgi:hypothetical protein
VKLPPLIRPAFAAFRTYWPAIVAIQLTALALVLAHRLVPEVDSALARVAQWKASGGYLFSGLATVLSAGVLPESIKRFFRPPDMLPPSAGELAHQFAMWFGLGLLVDAFYRLQNHLFGAEVDAATLMIKVLVDQGLFTPLVALPSIVLWTKWREVGYRPRAYLRSLSLAELKRRALPLWATCLIFWPVMLLFIYSLPALLQFPLFLLGNAAFSILMIFILRRQSP